MDEFSDGNAIFKATPQDVVWSKTNDPTKWEASEFQTFELYGYFKYDINLDAWVQSREAEDGVAFYTNQTKREWVGLMDEEIDVLVMDSDGLPKSHLEFAHSIEAKLKEKNT